MNVMNFTKTVMGNLVRKPVTRPYPYQPREYPERTRGRVVIDMDGCVFCSLCAKRCPTDAIRVNREGKVWTIERFDCIQCGCCVENCPKKCLHMEVHYPEPAGEKYTESFRQEG